MKRTRLFTPGPTPVPEEVMLAMARPIIHHRTEEFQETLRFVNESLAYLFVTEQPVMTLTASGTGAMEAAIANTMARGDEIITVNGGKFGERWGKIGRAYGLNVHEIMIEWGRAVTVEQIEESLREHPNARGLFLTHSETSTGAFTDVRGIAAALRPGFDGLIVVDGITAVGAHEMRFDDWDLDVVITGSQKGLMIPPGLAFAALSERAWKATERSDLPRFYFDLTMARKAHADADTPWTPAITLIIGLGKALEMLRAEGREEAWARHDRLARSLRAGVEALGLGLFAFPYSNALTSVVLPEGGEAIPSHLKKAYGITAAAGQDHLKGKIVRFSHLGYYDEGDMMTLIHYLEQTLIDLGIPHESGAGLSAAHRSLVAKGESL